MIMSLLQRIKLKYDLKRQQRAQKLADEMIRRNMIKEINQAKEVMKQAGRDFDEAIYNKGRSDVDIASLKLNDAQSEYVRLLIKARNSGIKANFADIEPLQARA
jgi:ribosomal protein S8E